MSGEVAATNAAVKAQRGTKRACQNPECGSRFYDLNRNPLACPSATRPMCWRRRPQRLPRGKDSTPADEEAGLSIESPSPRMPLWWTAKTCSGGR